MSDYCPSCHYDVKEKIGENACPFNSFYWYFLNQHDSKLSKNPRIRMIYSVWDNFSDDVRKQILNTAENNFERINHL